MDPFRPLFPAMLVALSLLLPSLPPVSGQCGGCCDDCCGCCNNNAATNLALGTAATTLALGAAQTLPTLGDQPMPRIVSLGKRKRRDAAKKAVVEASKFRFGNDPTPFLMGWPIPMGQEWTAKDLPKERESPEREWYKRMMKGRKNGE